VEVGLFVKGREMTQPHVVSKTKSDKDRRNRGRRTWAFAVYLLRLINISYAIRIRLPQGLSRSLETDEIMLGGVSAMGLYFFLH
jgi:hypothetical protein